MDNKPRLIVVSPTFPHPLVSGGKIRVYNILKHLSQRFSITLLSLAEPEDDSRNNRDALKFLERLVIVPINQNKIAQLMRLIGNWHRWLLGTPAEILVKRSTKMSKALERLLSSNKYDAVQIEYAQGMQYLPIVKSFGVPSLVVSHDVSFISQQRKAKVCKGIHRWFWRAESHRMRSYEQREWRNFERIVAMSEIDRSHILKLIPGAEVDIVPNGVDIVKFSIQSEDKIPTLVFVGWMRHMPNRDGLAWFLDTIWPIIREKHLTVQFQIIGRGLPKKLIKRVDSDVRIKYLGYIEDIQSFVGKAWISVVPIRIGSGSRLKILESLALGTPVVSTTVGCEGIPFRNGKEICIADKPDKFARTVIQLLADKEERMQLSSNGRKLVEKHYDWERIGMLAADSVLKTISISMNII